MKHSTQLIFILSLLADVNCKLKFEESEVYITKGECINAVLTCSEENAVKKIIKVMSDFSDIANVIPDHVNISCPYSTTLKICSTSHVGKTAISAENVNQPSDSTYFLLDVAKYSSLTYLTYIVGWIYFLAWSICFYPQVYENYRRKSVVGLHFDYVTLNLVGFILYSMFNCGLYFVPQLQEEYLGNHPRGTIPVLANDVMFSVHAVMITLIIIIQCFIYDKKSQKVSCLMKGFLVIYACILIIASIRAYDGKITWLQFLYYCNHIKLSTTAIKYIPQAYFNYTRKSTDGWSVGNVMLDFSGGLFSVMQMLITSYNYNDWSSFIGNATKLGLGIISMIFHTIFLYQHYCLYSHPHSNQSSEDFIPANDSQTGR